MNHQTVWLGLAIRAPVNRMPFACHVDSGYARPHRARNRQVIGTADCRWRSALNPADNHALYEVALGYEENEHWDEG